MEVYVDDMLVKSRSSGGHVADLVEAFETLIRYQMKLIPHMSTTLPLKKFWGSWYRREELRRILTKLRPSWKCNLLGR
jgi:hypothetical protein